MLGLSYEEFYATTPRELNALLEARVGILREDWGPFALAASLYFESNRDKEKPGRPITPDLFLPMIPSVASKQEELNREAADIQRESARRIEAGELPAWVKPRPFDQHRPRRLN